VKFWLLTRPWNQVQKLAMLEDYFEEGEEEKKKKKKSSQPQQKQP